MSRLYKISRAEKNSANVELKELTWEKIAKVLSQHKVGEEKDTRGNFVGGWFKGNYRNKENMEGRSLLTLDVDHYTGDLDDLEFDLSLLGYSYVVYSTWRSRVDDLRFRIVIPLNEDILANQYPALCRSFANKFKQFQFDLSGYKPEQFMYMPCVSKEVFDTGELFSFVSEGSDVKGIDIADFNLDQFTDEFDIDRSTSVDNDFELLIAQQPLDISSDEVDAYLLMYPANDLDYEAWLKVGAALHHQFQGDDLGYMRWVRWSEMSSKHDESLMPMKYRSFGKGKTKPVTFASIKWEVNQIGDSVEGRTKRIVTNSAVLEDLKEQAKAVSDDETYLTLASKLSRLNLAILSETQRQQLSVLIWESWGKSVGMTKGAIKKELMPPKRNRTAALDDAPDWVDGWVYVESECEFYNIDLHYGIKREAFNAKFDRENECLIAEKPASVMALTVWHIPTVVSCMFWPGAAEMFEYEGKKMLNSYRESGVRPWDGRVYGVEGEGKVDGVEGDRVVDRFLAHLKFMIEDEREQEIVLDWMTWIIQNPGNRVNWALLIQGTQGSGKSFLANVLQWVLGVNVRMLDPTAISGRFTAWAQGALVNVVEEIRISGENRWAIVDRMKPFISNTTVLIEEKGRDHRTVPNFTSYMMLTNHKDAIPLVKDDRRYCVIYGRVQSEEQLYAELGGAQGVEDYFASLFDESEKGADRLAYFFKTRRIVSGFSPKGRAPQTKARLEMIDYAVSDEHVKLVDAIEKYRCDVINEQIIDATYFRHLCEKDGDHHLHPKKLMHFLLEMGYRKLMKRIRIKSKNLNQTVWMRNTVPGANFTVPEENIEKIVKEFHENLILEDF